MEIADSAGLVTGTPEQQRKHEFSVMQRELLQQYGALVGGDALRQLLGYPSAEAFRQARHRKAIPIPLFRIPQRRGNFALSRDIAHWLAELRLAASRSFPSKGDAS